MSKEKLYKSHVELKAGNGHYGIVAARFNAQVVERLLRGALESLQDHGASETQITVLRVPGAFEIPLACQKLAQTGGYAALIALGCVIRGDTPHFHYVCSESARGVLEVSLKFDLPVINGILTVDSLEQAEARAAGDNNKGADAAKSAMEMLAMIQQLAVAAPERR
jgi:6,7-dimethyl-8-ribityllumazine synthase